MIPYGKHHIDQDDIKSVIKVLKGDHLTQGPLVKTFENAISKYVGVKYAVAVTSCTAGLHLAAIASNMKKGKTLLTSPITFVSTANSSLFCGAQTIFADVDFNVNLSVENVRRICSKNKINAISPVHFGGLPCDMKRLKKIADKHGALVYEDAAHAFGATFPDGSKVGSCKHSDMTVFSFHPVKSIAMGEGGIITTNDKKIFHRLLLLRNSGIERENNNFIYKNKSKEKTIDNPWYYEMQELGYHYRITDIQCALGLSQLKKINKFLNKRKNLAKRYDSELKDLKNCKIIHRGLRNNSSNHLYILKINFKKLGISRGNLMKLFKEKEIGTQVHYIPVTSHPYFRNKGYDKSNLPNSYEYYEGALSIPLYYDLTRKQQTHVIDQVKKLIG
jgi:UDP-4-amino-4,6-dideoxy-N-acetyl-beta-L-altrosamine transaminase